MSSRASRSCGEPLAALGVDLGAVDDDGERAVGARAVLRRRPGRRPGGWSGLGRLAAGVLRPGAHAQGGQRRAASSSSAAPIAHGSGRSADPAAPSGRSAASFVGLRGRLRTLRGSSRRPASPHSAGTRVGRRPATETTAIAVAKPNERVRRQPGQPQAQQRDQHGRGGEHHRATGGGRRPGRRPRARRSPARRYSTCRVTQQQRVVDADAEADHAWRPSGRRC